MSNLFKDIAGELSSKIRSLGTWRVIGSVLIVGIVVASLSGCNGFLVGNIKSHNATPKVFVKEGVERQQMTLDSLDCQDLALAADGNYDSYVSSMGYTEKQVQMYDNCMYAKGYKAK